VTGNQKSKCSSKLVAQIITKITNNRLWRQTDERETETEMKMKLNKM